MYLPQPVAACLRTPPAIVPVVLAPDSGAATYLLARWKCHYPFTLPKTFLACEEPLGSYSVRSV